MASTTSSAGSTESRLPALPGLAKTAATRQLAERLRTMGQSAGASDAIARAVVDPSAARRRLDALTVGRVPGGTLFALDALVWAPAVMPYPVNTRLASSRHYPAAGGDGSSTGPRFPPLRPATSESDVARLRLQVQSDEHLAWSVEHAIDELVAERSDLADSIGAQGVLVPVTVAVAEVVHDDDEPTSQILTTRWSAKRVTWRS